MGVWKMLKRDFDENNITVAVVEQFANTPDPRLKEIISSLVEHLHDFVRDVRLSFAEWTRAIDFLTRTGKLCSDTRQEFILLSDTLGLSMLVDAIDHPAGAGATESTVLGPFYVASAPELPLGSDLSGGLPGEPLFVEGIVQSSDGRPIADAIVDTWHSDTEGFYDVQRPGLSEPTLRGRFRSDANGRFHFWSIVPRFYSIPDDGPVGEMLRATARHPFRPAHVHFMISAPSHETLVTHIFDADSPHLDSDAVFGVKNSLIREFTREPGGKAPDGGQMQKSWRKLTYEFGLKQKALPTAKRGAA
jgi:hydroxyquinol 1,2-dioxygenase